MSDPAHKDEHPVLLTSAEVAKILRIKPSGLRTMVLKGHIVPDHRGGGGRTGTLRGHRFSMETVQRFLKGGDHG